MTREDWKRAYAQARKAAKRGSEFTLDTSAGRCLRSRERNREAWAWRGFRPLIEALQRAAPRPA